MAATPSGKGIPWHRVVGERGKLLIREPYASLQRKLLESEGLTLRESRVDIENCHWHPPLGKSSTAKLKSARKSK
jgi:alkylated DNA nucleotide flippase Atl1